MLRNDWIIKHIQDKENKRFHGKIILNFHAGEIPVIDVHESLQKDKKEDKIEQKPN